MHHKFAILNHAADTNSDDVAVLTGSFNWNARAANLNYENTVYIKSRKIADAFCGNSNGSVAEVMAMPGWLAMARSLPPSIRMS